MITTIARQSEPDNFLPVRVLDIEVGAPIPSIPCRDSADGKLYSSARALVRLHTAPMGSVDIEFNGSDASPEQIADRIWQELGDALLLHLKIDGIAVDKLTSSGISS
ncbi:MAG TPA: hypothetical protein VGK87_15170, partial [Anaerolineae bacterium]